MALVGTNWIDYLIEKSPDIAIAISTGLSAIYLIKTWRSGGGKCSA